MIKVECNRCNGKGEFEGFGTCFKCNGEKTIEVSESYYNKYIKDKGNSYVAPKTKEKTLADIQKEQAERVHRERMEKVAKINSIKTPKVEYDNSLEDLFDF